MNTENSKINESNKFRYCFTDKLNLKNRSKNIALVDLSICYTWRGKTLNLHIPTWNLRYLLQYAMMNLICLMDHILCQIFKIILSTLLRNTIL